MDTERSFGCTMQPSIFFLDMQNLCRCCVHEVKACDASLRKVEIPVKSRISYLRFHGFPRISLRSLYG